MMVLMAIRWKLPRAMADKKFSAGRLLNQCRNLKWENDNNN